MNIAKVCNAKEIIALSSYFKFIDKFIFLDM